MPGIFEVYVQTHFAAAHRLVGYAGDCARLHGHNWVVEVTVRCRELDGIGMGMDFRDIRERVKEVTAALDHQNLNALDAFREINPTSEHIARFLFRALSERINGGGVRVARVKVCETAGAGAMYWEEEEQSPCLCS